MTWPTKKLADLLETCDAGMWGKPAMKSKGLFVLRSTNMSNDGKLDFFDVAERKIKGDIKKVKLLDGDILVEKSGGGPDQPVGRVAYFITPNDQDYSFANFIQRLRANPDFIDSRFLFYHLLFLHKIGFTKKLQSQTTGIRNLKLSLYLKTEIPLPPIKIQRKIVERLDAIKKAQELNDKQIELTEELFQSLRQKEFNRMDKWNKPKLDDFVKSSQLGLVKSRGEQGKNLKYPYIKMDNITLLGDLSLNSLTKVNAEPQEVKKYQLQDNDFLFNTRNTPELVGKNAIFRLENKEKIFLYNNNILKLQFTNKAKAHFVNYYLYTPEGKRQLDIRKQGTTSVCAIYQGDLFTIKVPLPSIETQQKIVEKLSAAQDYKKKLLEQKQKLQELFESVLAKSFTGKLIK